MAEPKFEKFGHLYKILHTYVFKVTESKSDIIIENGGSYKMIHKFQLALKIFLTHFPM